MPTRNKTGSPCPGNRFRHIDMVLIDDFQYFAGRTALQEQLLQTLRALHQAGR